MHFKHVYKSHIFQRLILERVWAHGRSVVSRSGPPYNNRWKKYEDNSGHAKDGPGDGLHLTPGATHGERIGHPLNSIPDGSNPVPILHLLTNGSVTLHVAVEDWVVALFSQPNLIPYPM